MGKKSDKYIGKDKQQLLGSLEQVEQHIHLIRGQKVMLDSDLAELYEIKTKRLNEQIKRNPDRFPEDFMFQLNHMEYDALRSQFVTLETGRGKHAKYLPYVFTEQGVAMLSSVINSEKAIQLNIAIMRTFVKLRHFLINSQSNQNSQNNQSNQELARKAESLIEEGNSQLKKPIQEPKKMLAEKSNKQELAKNDGFEIFCPTYQYKDAMEAMERELLIKVLRESGNDAQKAMELSGIPRSTFYRLMKSHNLKVVGLLTLVNP